jgi:Predicted membrane protein
MEPIIGYLVILNVVGLFSMWLDKRKAIQQKWRIKEATLLTIALLGGSIGSWIGMRVFRHKTKHMSFLLGIPVILFLQIAGVIAFYHFFT